MKVFWFIVGIGGVLILIVVINGGSSPESTRVPGPQISITVPCGTGYFHLPVGEVYRMQFERCGSIWHQWIVGQGGRYFTWGDPEDEYDIQLSYDNGHIQSIHRTPITSMGIIHEGVSGIRFRVSDRAVPATLRLRRYADQPRNPSLYIGPPQ